MVHFSRLKLYGFKSFVDKTELEIGAGLNGIVGPNGCGKSNLVEALRWVMGEKSAKNMRGSGMEDVIFAGTSKRPARSLAEVTVVMNNEDGAAPAPFNAATEIEINRKIEKDKGSQYRVNGKAVRARDVNLLFADTMTGATSPALVSQGRITEIIMAKPSDRRKILEESAGISGLHTRRHEAELRLRAADQNLTRLDDSLGEVRSRLSSLKRQARQAERYKEISDEIRKFDMALVWGEWQTCHTLLKAQRSDFEASNTNVQSALVTIQSMTKSIDAIELTLPDARKDHMEASAVLQNFRVSLERLEHDLHAKTKGLQDAIENKNQMESDQEYLIESLNDILNELDTAQNAMKSLQDDQTSLPEQIEKTEINLDKKREYLQSLMNEKQSIETAMRVAREGRDSLIQQLNDATTRKQKQKDAINTLLETTSSTQSDIDNINKNGVLSFDFNLLDEKKIKLSDLISNAEQSHSTLLVKKSELQSTYNDLNARINNLNGEYQALKALLNQSKSNEDELPDDQKLINHLKVEKGYEKAISTVLGQWLSQSSVNRQGDVYWANGNVTVATPETYSPLSDFINAPDALMPILKASAICDTLPNANTLEVGQCLVTKNGDMMRWDGLHVSGNAKAQDNSTLILEQQNRIKEITSTLSDLNNEKDQHHEGLSNLAGTLDESLQKIDELKNDLRLSEQEQADKANQRDRLKDQLSSLQSRLDDFQSRHQQHQDDLAITSGKIDELELQLDATADDKTDGNSRKIEKLDENIETVRQDSYQTQSDLSDLKQQLKSREDNEKSFTEQIERSTTQREKANKRLEDIGERIESLDAKIVALTASQNNEDADSMREGLLNKIANQETSLKDIACKLETEENTYKSLQQDLRKAENDAAEAREKRATLNANIANTDQDMERIQTDIADRFELSHQALEARVFSLFDSEIPKLNDLHDHKEKLTRQRDGIGPVNLRAAIESQETEAHLADMEGEYNDLTKAIEQLRGGIAKLNREAKDRLDIAFTRVNQHFETLFGQLFEGGQAHLSMIESDDPLESGLEIFAQPPGKSLQKLSLLSGGEQTLTAIALIFAMFLTNPSPICVLDEIDAPLDDANVDRVCTLMENIARDTNTRFIVITHHRMTMARMDRLYGVTMSERGVSQLVSVDIALQEEMNLLETA